MKTKEKKQTIKYVEDTFEEYLSKKDHIAASDVKNFMNSPKLFYYEKFEKVKDESKAERHFSIGSALHELVLQPKLFLSNYIVTPKFDRRTSEGKLGYAEFQLKAEGKTLLAENEMTMIKVMAENALKHKTLTELLSNSVREVSCYTTDPITGLKIRMRPDSLSMNKSTITDIKTCQSANRSKFKNDVYKFGYSTSAAYYCDFLGRENYVFAGVEKTQPHQVALYYANDEMIEYGRTQYRTALDLIKWSFDNDYWCSYNEFEILKECYELGDLDSFFDTIKDSQLVTIL